jgi:ankyrin repeat protein
MISIFHGRDRMARMLIEHGADIRERCLTGYDEFTTLHMAVMVRSAGIVELLLEKGVDVEGQDASMQTPLHWAMVKAGWQSAETGDRDWMRIVRALLRNGANVESQDIQGRTPRDVATPHQSRILDQLLHENMEHEPS